MELNIGNSAPALLSHGVPLSITLLLALLAGALDGVLWGLLPAALKIWRNINEIITILMMSFLGVSLANVLVKLLLAALLIHAVINHTAFGLSIRVMGASPRAA